jgi:hypothetical protein
MVLAHLRIYLLGENHDVTSEQTHEFGEFSFGRKKTTIARSMRPYLII